MREGKSSGWRAGGRKPPRPARLRVARSSHDAGRDGGAGRLSAHRRPSEPPAAAAAKVAFPPVARTAQFIRRHARRAGADRAMPLHCGNLSPAAAPSRMAVNLPRADRGTAHIACGRTGQRKSEFSRQIAVDLEPDADLDEDGRGPGHGVPPILTMPDDTANPDNLQ